VHCLKLRNLAEGKRTWCTSLRGGRSCPNVTGRREPFPGGVAGKTTIERHKMTWEVVVGEGRHSDDELYQPTLYYIEKECLRGRVKRGRFSKSSEVGGVGGGFL